MIFSFKKSKPIKKGRICPLYLHNIFNVNESSCGKLISVALRIIDFISLLRKVNPVGERRDSGVLRRGREEEKPQRTRRAQRKKDTERRNVSIKNLRAPLCSSVVFSSSFFAGDRGAGAASAVFFLVYLPMVYPAAAAAAGFRMKETSSSVRL
jgi:hypothetical protein